MVLPHCLACPCVGLQALAAGREHQSHFLLAVGCPAPAAEVLDVRWANDDPNPRAVARVQHEREVALRDAYVKVGSLLGRLLEGPRKSEGWATAGMAFLHVMDPHSCNSSQLV